MRKSSHESRLCILDRAVCLETKSGVEGLSQYVVLTMYARRLTCLRPRPVACNQRMRAPAPTLLRRFTSVYKRFVKRSKLCDLRLRMEKRGVFLSLFLILALVQLAVCQDPPDCSALQVPFSGAPFSGELAITLHDGEQAETNAPLIYV